MSNEQEEKELKEMEQQLIEAAEAEKEKAAKEEETLPALPPDPIASPAPQAESSQDVPVTPSQPEAKPKEDNPMEWAQKKGFKTPEDMARALLQKEREFHQSKQKTEPTPPPPPTWQPQPSWGNQYPGPGPGYTYSPQPYAPRPMNGDVHSQLAANYDMHPDDVRRFMPLVVDAAEAIANRRTQDLQRQVESINRATERNNELMTLMQDSAFRNEAVQEEIHKVLDSDPTIFQRAGAYTEAFQRALGNMARKQLQQGVIPEKQSNGSKPPVTAGGGNGSSFTAPRPMTEKELAKLSIAEQEKFLVQMERSRR